MEKRCRETPRNATPDESLTPTQDLAIAALLAGKTITAAGEASVDRGTVHRWLKEDFAFQAALNRGQRELRCVAYGRLERLAEKAVDTLERALDKGDAKAALGIVKGLGILAPSSIGSGDAPELAASAARAKAQAEAEAELAGIWTLELRDDCATRRMMVG